MKTRTKFRMKRTPKRYINREPRGKVVLGEDFFFEHVQGVYLFGSLDMSEG